MYIQKHTINWHKSKSIYWNENKKKKSKNGKWTKAILIKESYSDLPFSQVHGESLRNMSHKEAVSALRSASSPVRITIYREDPESIFTSSEGNEWLHNNLYFIAVIGNIYHSHIIILFCLFFLIIVIVLLLFLFLRMYLSQRPCVPGIPWFMLYTFSLHSDTEPSAIFEVNLVKSITDYIGFSILARKYVLHNRYFVKKKNKFLSLFYFIFIFSLFFFILGDPWRDEE